MALALKQQDTAGEAPFTPSIVQRPPENTSIDYPTVDELVTFSDIGVYDILKNDIFNRNSIISQNLLTFSESIKVRALTIAERDSIERINVDAFTTLREEGLLMFDSRTGTYYFVVEFNGIALPSINDFLKGGEIDMSMVTAFIEARNNLMANASFNPELMRSHIYNLVTGLDNEYNLNLAAELLNNYLATPEDRTCFLNTLIASADSYTILGVFKLMQYLGELKFSKTEIDSITRLEGLTMEQLLYRQVFVELRDFINKFPAALTYIELLVLEFRGFLATRNAELSGTLTDLEMNNAAQYLRKELLAEFRFDFAELRRRSVEA